MKCGGGISVKTLIQSLGNGVWPHTKWISASGLVGILGFASFVLALKKDAKFGNSSGFSWLSEREKRPEILCLVPGLQNLGNNCFLNVILQALASCTYFLPFLQKVMEDCEEPDEDSPLTVALVALLEACRNDLTSNYSPTLVYFGENLIPTELCLVGERRIVLSPRKLMRALELYIRNFNLTSQQDAEEAFLHLISSLREEFSECYNSNISSLADAFDAANYRVRPLNRTNGQSEQERWQKHLFGPFDGILSSILTCQSCSSQISLDYQFFHSLPLSPVLDSGSTIMVGCTLEDCLKQFLTAEQVENYHCSHCWHNAAMKYLSLTGENKMEIEELRRCAQDSCDCRNRLHLEKLPWSNKFSHTLKQLRISQCPKILCIHLQRVSIDALGELVKLRGHIDFPLLLDLYPYMRSGLGIKDLEESWKRGQGKVLNRISNYSPNHVNQKPNSMYGLLEENICSKTLGANELYCTANGKPSQEDSILALTRRNSGVSCTVLQKQTVNEVNVTSPCPSETYVYRLASVVEHFGRVGSGHYTVYRSLRGESPKETPDDHFETPHTRWFCISDSQVYIVPVNDVLAAEASLLFYERVTES